MKSSKAITLILLALIAIAATALATLKEQTQKIVPEKEQEQATVIQEGQMTEKQKRHSKLFKGYNDVTKGKKLRELVAERGDVNAGRFVPEQIVPRLTLDEYIRSLTCKADAIVRGSVKNKSSQIIDEGTFVFTDYQIIVGDIVKNNSLTPIQTSSEITVTRSGGSVKLNGHVVRTVDYSQQTLDVGASYLLFLRFDPATGDYHAINSSTGEDTFRVRDNRLSQVSSVPLPLGVGVDGDVTAFMIAIQNSLIGPCTH